MRRRGHWNGPVLRTLITRGLYQLIGTGPRPKTIAPKLEMQGYNGGSLVPTEMAEGEVVTDGGASR